MTEIGRPTKYDPRYCEEIIDFFTRDLIDPDTKKPCELPTLAKFAVSIGVHRETLINWTKVNTCFFDAYKKAKNLQEDILIQNGLLNRYNPALTIFCLKNICSWKDKIEQEVVNDNDKKLVVNIYDASKKKEE